LVDYIAYIVVRLLNRIFALVPISACLWIGRRFGTAAFFVNKKRRLIAYSNLKAAFAMEKSPAELKGITKRVYQNMVQTFFEVLNLTKVDKKYVEKYIDIANIECLHEAVRTGNGVVLLTGHFGDWELLSLVSSVIGFPILVLAREQKMKRLNDLLNRLRESNGCKVISKGMPTKNLFKALYAKKVIGILSDQDAGKNGMFVDFFGRPTSSHSGPFEIAKRTGAVIIPNFAVRQHGPYHKVFLEDYLKFSNTVSADEIRENLQKFTALLEKYVRLYPDQWLWLHKRWKSTPVRTVLVLSDGKAGHINQSLSIAAQIKKARVERGFKPEDTVIKVVDVKLKNPIAKTLLSACASFASWRCHGCMRCMKYCLTKDSYDILMKTHSEYVISCGSDLAAVNIFMSKENCARNVIVMKPNIAMGLKKYDLAVIPEHDKPPAAPNVVATRLAPNMVCRDSIGLEGEKLKRRVKLGSGKIIGLFIGGDNPEFALAGEAVDNVIRHISEFSNERNAEFLVTTSRRTSHEAEEVIKIWSRKDKRCRLAVLANEDNPPGTVTGILSLSDVAVVSGESVSMVSEAISSGKKVVVFMPRKKTDAVTKHEMLLASLEREGYIRVSTIDGLSRAVRDALEAGAHAKVPDDAEKIYEAVRRLI